eukprot:TRINITY_DN8930_c0_g1_i1.p1 TRINITY_DN8930_c0_g1~~TRINITY_DN8930_c0_g1_i1.p1  ORF type:complete len:129 (+),score=57.90 TRINITY_DN8930_c0_g1_i1:55-441(+)
MATSFATSKGRALEFRIKLGNKQIIDGDTHIQEFMLCRRISKKKWRVVLTLELDSDKNKKARINTLFRNKNEILLIIQCDCTNREVSVTPFWECRDEGWNWSASTINPIGDEWEQENLEFMSKADETD